MYRFYFSRAFKNSAYTYGILPNNKKVLIHFLPRSFYFQSFHKILVKKMKKIIKYLLTMVFIEIV